MTEISHPVRENPTPGIGDGRNLDPSRADEHGEGASIRVDDPASAWPIPADAQPHPDRVPTDTYYDLPVVKAPPWSAYVPAYFHAGGLAGAAASLAGAVQLLGNRDHAALERKLHWIAIAGEAVGGAFLIADLGRPERFLNMMRVFRPTSPMNVGTWILSAAGATSGLSLLRSLTSRDATPRPTFAGITGALAGTLLSTYTGVLLGNTSIPIWHATRRELPLWFASLSASSLASTLELLGGSPKAQTRLVRAYSIVAKAASIAAQNAVERRAESAGVGDPLHSGRSGQMWRWSRWLSFGSFTASLFPGTRRIAGALGTASALLSRFAIADAGRASAADPRATFEPQRATARASASPRER
ncbi:MAG: polysulfide reductase NrfD [Kofleriaceae bacterium]|nr:polysulfide reductase NrfD [Kofleriaceae bacterium]